MNTSAGIVVFNSAIQTAIPDALRGRVFTLLDMTWNLMRLLSLAIGGLVVDMLGVQAVFCGRGTLLTLTGLLGLVLLGRSYPLGHRCRRTDLAAARSR